MSFQIKECIFCHRKLPLSQFNKNQTSSDGYWNWCKQCEKIGSYSEKIGNHKSIVSFSGGKDSTALLLLMIEKGIKVDAAIYYNCGSFEFPQMQNHIEKMKLICLKNCIEFVEIGPKIDFFEMAYLYRPEGKKEYNGWPTPSLRWCTMMKLNGIKQRLRMFRPYIQHIGFAVDENDRVLKAAVQTTKQKRGFFENRFLLSEWNMTEKDCLSYCFKKGYNWDGLYDHFDRVSCWCCPLQSQKDLISLAKYHPDLWIRFKEMNKKIVEKTGRHFQDDPTIFLKIEYRAGLR